MRRLLVENGQRYSSPCCHERTVLGVQGTTATWELARSMGRDQPRQAFAQPLAGPRASSRDPSAADRGQRARSPRPQQRELFLPDGAPAAVGSTLRNPTCSHLHLLGQRGPAPLPRAARRDIVDTCGGRRSTRLKYRVRPAYCAGDIARYRPVLRAPHLEQLRGSRCRMAPPSSGAQTVGEARTSSQQ